MHLKNKILVKLLVVLLLLLFTTTLGREIYKFNEDWKFSKGNISDAHQVEFNDSEWENVRIPHDWAIKGPFDPNGDPETGKLPWKGEGWYRKTFQVPENSEGKEIYFLFDGIMAFPKIYINEQLAGQWDYGYNSFYLNVTSLLKHEDENTIAIHVDTREIASRWYPGAGIYRKIQLIITDPIHVDIWGTYLFTPVVEDSVAEVRIFTTVNNFTETDTTVAVESKIIDPDGKEVASIIKTHNLTANGTFEFEHLVEVNDPAIWDTDNPNLYLLESIVRSGDRITDEYKTTFGIRTIKFTSNEGFHLNGKRIQLKGVNLHHDLGPFGSAFNKKAMRRQLEIMKRMGANAIRNSHNIAAPEVLELCDEMGLLFFNEAFDKWDRTAALLPSADFYQHMERNMANFMRRDRNHPCVIIWSIGNEIRDIQRNDHGSYNKLNSMVGYVTQYDRTRPVTMATDEVHNVHWRHFDLYDVHSWNYDRRYLTARSMDSTKAVIISESASTVSTRGFYDTILPTIKNDYFNDELQISSYDMNAPHWAESPDLDFYWQEEDKYVCGEFVWTGFDYLGEPTPMNLWVHPEKEFKPEDCAKSSFFGIVDLAGIPKDRYYLYKSYWNKNENMTHILPHWNWAGNEGKYVPVFVYTNGDSAELFLNGHSLGIQKKLPNSDNPYERYRLMWNQVEYEEGELKAVAYKNGETIGEANIRTAGDPNKLKLSAEYDALKADGEDLTFILVEAIDGNGIINPFANDLVNFELEGPAEIVGVGNGNPHSLEPFHTDYRELFYGKAMLIIRSTDKNGVILISAKSDKLESASIEIISK